MVTDARPRTSGSTMDRQPPPEGSLASELFGTQQRAIGHAKDLAELNTRLEKFLLQTTGRCTDPIPEVPNNSAVAAKAESLCGTNTDIGNSTEREIARLRSHLCLLGA